MSWFLLCNAKTSHHLLGHHTINRPLEELNTNPFPYIGMSRWVCKAAEFLSTGELMLRSQGLSHRECKIDFHLLQLHTAIMSLGCHSLPVMHWHRKIYAGNSASHLRAQLAEQPTSKVLRSRSACRPLFCHSTCRCSRPTHTPTPSPN